MKQTKKEELNKVITAMNSFDNNISILRGIVKNTHLIHTQKNNPNQILISKTLLDREG